MCWNHALRSLLQSMKSKKKVTPPISSVDEVERVSSVDEDKRISSLNVDDYMREIRHWTNILTKEHVTELLNLVPASVIGCRWIPLFNTMDDGFSMRTVYKKVADYNRPLILLIKDHCGAIFGAVLTNTLKPNPRFYGDGESFLFTFYPKFKAFRSTGVNTYFIKADVNFLGFGLGNGIFGLWIDRKLNRGTSHKCHTFDNEVLSSSPHFFVCSLEIWGFSYDMARPTC